MSESKSVSLLLTDQQMSVTWNPNLTAHTGRGVICSPLPASLAGPGSSTPTLPNWAAPSSVTLCSLSLS
jgi:hypothetical protein